MLSCSGRCCSQRWCYSACRLGASRCSSRLAPVPLGRAQTPWHQGSEETRDASCAAPRLYLPYKCLGDPFISKPFSARVLWAVRKIPRSQASAVSLLSSIWARARRAPTGVTLQPDSALPGHSSALSTAPSFAQGWFDAGPAAPTPCPSLRHRPAGTSSREARPLRPRPPLPPSAGKHVPRQTRTRADTACGNQNGIRAGTRHAQARRIHRPVTAQRSRDPGSSDAAHAPRCGHDPTVPIVSVPYKRLKT